MTQSEVTDIIAISQMTPDLSASTALPTLVTASGSILGSVVATTAIILPSFIIMITLVVFLYASWKQVHGVCFLGLRPVVIGLIGAAAVLLMTKENFIDYISFIIFGTVFLLSMKGKIHPIALIVMAGIAGFVIY